MRKFFALLISALACTALVAETKKENGYELTLKTTRAEAIYNLKENATFKLQVTKDAQPVSNLEIKGQFTKDSVAPRTPISGVTNENGEFEVSGKINEAGFLKCQLFVTLPSESADNSDKKTSKKSKC